MRILAGCVLLLIAAATLGQENPKDDLLHGRPNTYEEVEIRPGIILRARYDADGAAEYMTIAPSWQPRGALWRKSTIPRETVDSILGQLLPTETYGKPTLDFLSCFSCPCYGFEQLKGVTIWSSECPIPTHEVVDVLIVFGLPPPLSHAYP